MEKFLEILTNLDAVSGNEEKLHEVILKELEGFIDSYKVTPLKNLIVVKKGEDSSHRILLDAHIDEVGGWISGINERGFLSFQTDSIDQRLFPGLRVVVHTEDKDYTGIIGLKPPHVMSKDEMKKALPLKDLFIDIGYSKEEVEKRVKIGDTVTFKGEFVKLLNDRFVNKAMDDRAAAVAIVEAIKLLKNTKHPYDVIGVFAVQEEETMFGALTSAYYIKPDIGIAIDVTHGDMMGVPPDETFNLGEGPTILVGPNIHEKVFGLLKKSAEKEEISYKVEADIYSGTDGMGIQVTEGGIPTGVIGIPLKYMHTPVEMLELKDLERTVRLLVSVVKNFDLKFLEELNG